MSNINEPVAATGLHVTDKFVHAVSVDRNGGYVRSESVPLPHASDETWATFVVQIDRLAQRLSRGGGAVTDRGYICPEPISEKVYDVISELLDYRGVRISKSSLGTGEHAGDWEVAFRLAHNLASTLRQKVAA